MGTKHPLAEDFSKAEQILADGFGVILAYDSDAIVLRKFNNINPSLK